MLNAEMSSRGSSPSLIGRAAEMTALSAAVDTVRRGAPATLLIGGEAGVGKTRLVTEFFAAGPVRPLTGACLEMGTDGLPFGPFTGEPVPDGKPLGLTGRETEVLRLVAAGRSNRRIAEELFISPGTASVHVSHILRKLGVATRAEAAARAHALRLFG